LARSDNGLAAQSTFRQAFGFRNSIQYQGSAGTYRVGTGAGGTSDMLHRED